MPVRVYHRDGIRKLALAFVMVCDYHVHAQRVGEFHFLVPGNAAVHGNHQRGALIP